MKRTLLALIITTTSTTALSAINVTDNFTISGFGTTSITSSDNDNPLFVTQSINDDTCYDCDTTFGIQLDYYLNNLRASAQLVKRPQDHWNEPELEWAYIAYEYNNIEFKGGRLRLPLFLYSEYFYVGHAYTQARPPAEVYNSVLGITAFNGFSADIPIELNDTQTLTFTPFYGMKDTSKVELNDTTTLQFETNQMFGLRTELTGDTYQWFLTYLYSDYDQQTKVTGLTFDHPVHGTVPIPDIDTISKGETLSFWTAGTSYDFESITVSAEAQHSDIGTSWYVSSAYSLGNFTPYLTYGEDYNDSSDKSWSTTAGVRYNIHFSVSLNLEWTYFDATNGHNGEFTETLNENDTANLYTAMLNFVF